MAHAVIVGAGPAGAALSYLLARRGVAVTLLERHADFAREFRGEVLMPSGLDAFAQMGLADALAAVPQTTIEAIEVYRGARRLLQLDETAVLGVAPRVVSQPAMLEMLVAEAGRHAGFRLERGATVRDLVWEGERVVGVRAESADGGREIRGDVVVGTDGRASVLRVRAGLHEERAPQAFDVVWCKVPTPPFLAGTRTARAYLGRGHGALFIPSYDGRLQIGWIIDKGSFGELRRRGVEGWLDEMARHVSPDLAAHLRAHAAEVTHPFLLDVVCDRLVRWTRPGLLLLGDAAHPMSPVGGQGINVALRDTIVAANHLYPVLAGAATPSEVDAAARRVVDERLPEVAEIQRMQQGPPQVVFARGRLRTALFDALFPVLARSWVGRRAFAAVARRFAYGITTVRLAV